VDFLAVLNVTPVVLKILVVGKLLLCLNHHFCYYAN
jgi:hypothetical protein